MGKGFLFLVFTFALLFTLSAQQYQNDYSHEKGEKKDVFWGVGLKGNVYVNDNATEEFEVWKMPTFGVNVFAGQWFSPIVGGRIVLETGKLTPYFQQRTVMVEENYALGRLDFLFNLTNCYRRDYDHRIYCLIPYAGVSGAYAFNAKNRPDNATRSSSFFFGVGLINSFHLSDNFSLFLNFGFDYIGADFDGSKSVKELNGIASASIGFVVDF